MRNKAPDLIVTVEGARLRWIYDDRARGLLELGDAQIRRASHVEPAPSGGWSADMGPVAGPVLGPFITRAAALAAERAYLINHVL